jgi:hypothetical protein
MYLESNHGVRSGSCRYIMQCDVSLREVDSEVCTQVREDFPTNGCVDKLCSDSLAGIKKLMSLHTFVNAHSITPL